MVFSSAVFLFFFFPVTMAGYLLLPARFRNFFLFAASLVFYAWGEPRYIFIMLFSTVFDYANGLALERWDDRPALRRAVLIASVTVNIGLLGFFKYTDFFLETVNSLGNFGLSTLQIALPIGISFYTFQTLSYTIDVYRRQVPAQHNLIAFGMYISMFPQLIAGPIVRYIDIAGQLNDRRLSAEQTAKGLFRFTAGLCKKVLIANQIGALWEEIARKGGQLPLLTAWIGAAAFAFQIYFDFSGYSDMAIGMGQCFGFSLPENFRYPYESGSITEFWRRWHITLGTWFREYVYIPLGGNRRGLPRQIANLFAVWFLTGLWHGAGFNFIFWGLFFFAVLVLEKLFLLKLLQKAPRVIATGYTLLLVLVSWVIFACEDLSVLGRYLASLFGANGLASPGGFYYLTNYGLLFLIAALFSTHLPKAAFKWCVRKAGLRETAVFSLQAAASVLALALCVIFLISDAYNPFLYFRF